MSDLSPSEREALDHDLFSTRPGPGPCVSGGAIFGSGREFSADTGRRPCDTHRH